MIGSPRKRNPTRRTTTTPPEQSGRLLGYTRVSTTQQVEDGFSLDARYDCPPVAQLLEETIAAAQLDLEVIHAAVRPLKQRDEDRGNHP